MGRYEEAAAALRRDPRRWLVTGVAGFIGSHLVERLLELGQEVVGVDDFSTGHRGNLEEVRAAVGEAAAARFRLVEADVAAEGMSELCQETDVVLHQAALGSVPRSLADPRASHRVNVNGFLNLLLAAREAGVERFVYASSSSVYGDHTTLPKREERIGAPLSPYAATKVVDELYAGVAHQCWGVPAVGLRYFNVFGPRQDPEGPYAAVIPRWIAALGRGEACVIYGDGETSRDFCAVENAVRANLLAALVGEEGVAGEVFNVACGDRTTLSQLYRSIRERVGRVRPEVATWEPRHEGFRPGDVRHSLADIGKARQRLGYEVAVGVGEGLDRTVTWFLGRQAPRA